MEDPHLTTTHDAIGQSQVTWEPHPPSNQLSTWGPDHTPQTVQTCSLGTISPALVFDLFKLVHYVTHIFIGKWDIGLRLKGLLI